MVSAVSEQPNDAIDPHWLPHAPPFLLVDRVVSHGPAGIVGEKYLAADSWCSQTGDLPALLLCESLAQLTKLLEIARGDPGDLSVLAALEVEFLHAPAPFGVVRLEARPLARFGQIVRYQGSASQEGIRLLNAKLTRRLGAGELLATRARER